MGSNGKWVAPVTMSTALPCDRVVVAWLVLVVVPLLLDVVLPSLAVVCCLRTWASEAPLLACAADSDESCDVGFEFFV